MTTRRRFLQSTLGTSALLSAGANVPMLLTRTAAAAQGKSRGEGILVVVQLSGGNDGLNTVVPFADPLYAKNRAGLAIDASSVVKLDREVGLHPSLRPFGKLVEAGRLAVVQGVGYPNPDRSHFSSMDIWHTAERAVEKQSDGWLGRVVDRGPRGDGQSAAALHLGAGPLPLAMVSRSTAVPSVETLDGFRLRIGRGMPTAEEFRKLAAAPRGDDSDMLAFLQRTTLGAYSSSQRVQDALGAKSSSAVYPNHRLAGKLKSIAQLIDADLPTRIYYVSLNGFDTHANQRQTHANLLSELAESVAAFVNDLAERGHVDRTCVLMFSEFGRRVKENASLGTDHGTAAPLFVAGGGLKAGLIGKHPRLDDLDREGDMKFHTDFRAVYAAILERTLDTPSREVLNGDFLKAAVFAN